MGAKGKAYELIEEKLEPLMDVKLFVLIDKAVDGKLVEFQESYENVLLNLGAVPWVANEGKEQVNQSQTALADFVAVDFSRLYILRSILEASEYLVTEDPAEKKRYLSMLIEPVRL